MCARKKLHVSHKPQVTCKLRISQMCSLWLQCSKQREYIFKLRDYDHSTMFKYFYLAFSIFKFSTYKEWRSPHKHRISFEVATSGPGMAKWNLKLGTKYAITSKPLIQTLYCEDCGNAVPNENIPQRLLWPICSHMRLEWRHNMGYKTGYTRITTLMNVLSS